MCLFERLNILKIYEKRVKQPVESSRLFYLNYNICFFGFLHKVFLKFGAIPGTLFIYFIFSLRDLQYNIHPRDGLRLLGIFLSWV